MHPRRPVRRPALLTTVLAGALALSACTSGAPVRATTPSATDPAAPQSIEFVLGDAPTATFDEDTAESVDLSHDATFVGGSLLVRMRGSGIASFGPDDSAPAWTLDGFGDRVGPGSTRGIELRTSSAAGGTAFVGYSEECFWEKAPCTGAPKGTYSIIGIAAVAASSKKVVWRSELVTAGPQGSKTDDAGIYLEPEVADADGKGVLVTVSSNDGRPTPGGLAGMTTYLLDAETGKVQWKTAGFRGMFLTDGRVFGQGATDREQDRVGSTTVTRSVRRSDGAPAALTLRSTLPQNVQGVGGAGMLLQDSDTRNVDMETRNLYLVDAQGAGVPSGADDQNLAQATCPEHRTEGLLACAVMARSTDSVLVTWADGEPAVSRSRDRRIGQVRAGQERGRGPETDLPGVARHPPSLRPGENRPFRSRELLRPVHLVLWSCERDDPPGATVARRPATGLHRGLSEHPLTYRSAHYPGRPCTSG